MNTSSSVGSVFWRDRILAPLPSTSETMSETADSSVRTNFRLVSSFSESSMNVKFSTPLSTRANSCPA